MPENCIFCKIIQGTIPADILYEDENVMAFRDVNPVAPQHFLVIPKKHITGPAAVTAEEEKLAGLVLTTGARLAEENGIDHFRMVLNNGEGAGQTVFHLHLHVLGGRAMGWPPG